MSKSNPMIADNFTDAYNFLGKELKEKGLFDAYYVERAESPIDYLREEILMDESPSKILFSGHRSCGKTTELHRLTFELEDEYFTIYFSAYEELELADLDYKDILLALILKTLRSLEESKVEISKDTTKRLYDFLGQLSGEVVVKRVEDRTKRKSIGVKLSQLILDIGASYKTEATTRKEIRQRAESLIAEVIEGFNMLVAEATEKLKKPILIIADDLDKVDLKLAMNIFYDHSASLRLPNCKIIFTVPVSIIYSENFKHIQMSLGNTITLPLPKMKNKAGEINKDWIDTFKGIVSKRVSTDLFEKGVLTKLALQSGGLVVDYLRMVRDCLVKAKVRNMDKVDEDSAGETFDDLISDYRRVINEEFYEKLKDVNENKKTENDDDLRRLLHILAILEYVDNSENWYDVHPAIEPLLLEKGLIK